MTMQDYPCGQTQNTMSAILNDVHQCVSDLHAATGKVENILRQIGVAFPEENECKVAVPMGDSLLSRMKELREAIGRLETRTNLL